MIAQMVEMGFSVEDSLDALMSTSNDIEQACILLTQGVAAPTAAAAAVATATHFSTNECQRYVHSIHVCIISLWQCSTCKYVLNILAFTN